MKYPAFALPQPQIHNQIFGPELFQVSLTLFQVVFNLKQLTVDEIDGVDGHWFF